MLKDFSTVKYYSQFSTLKLLKTSESWACSTHGLRLETEKSYGK